MLFVPEVTTPAKARETPEKRGKIPNLVPRVISKSSICTKILIFVFDHKKQSLFNLKQLQNSGPLGAKHVQISRKLSKNETDNDNRFCFSMIRK